MKQTPLKRKPMKPRTRSVSPASPAQRAKVRDRACIVCNGDEPYFRIDPAHVIPRSLGGCDEADCVIPLCRKCHRAYDEGEFDLLPHLEPRHRDEQAHAVLHVGLEYARNRLVPLQYRKDAA